LAGGLVARTVGVVFEVDARFQLGVPRLLVIWLKRWFACGGRLRRSS